MDGDKDLCKSCKAPLQVVALTFNLRRGAKPVMDCVECHAQKSPKEVLLSAAIERRLIRVRLKELARRLAILRGP